MPCLHGTVPMWIKYSPYGIWIWVLDFKQTSLLVRWCVTVHFLFSARCTSFSSRWDLLLFHAWQPHLILLLGHFNTLSVFDNIYWHIHRFEILEIYYFIFWFRITPIAKTFVKPMFYLFYQMVLPFWYNFSKGFLGQITPRLVNNILTLSLDFPPIKCIPHSFRYLDHTPEEEITEFVKCQLTLPGKLDPADELSWQHHLYSTLGNKKSMSASEMKQEALDLLVHRIVAMGRCGH